MTLPNSLGETRGEEAHMRSIHDHESEVTAKRRPLVTAKRRPLGGPTRRRERKKKSTFSLSITKTQRRRKRREYRKR